MLNLEELATHGNTRNQRFWLSSALLRKWSRRWLTPLLFPELTGLCFKLVSNMWQIILLPTVKAQSSMGRFLLMLAGCIGTNCSTAGWGYWYICAYDMSMSIWREVNPQLQVPEYIFWYPQSFQRVAKSYHFSPLPKSRRMDLSTGIWELVTVTFKCGHS